MPADIYDVAVIGGGAAGLSAAVALGGRDELPDAPGLASQWGKGVVHCGFCHGYEVRDQRIGIAGHRPDVGSSRVRNPPCGPAPRTVSSPVDFIQRS